MEIKIDQSVIDCLKEMKQGCVVRRLTKELNSFTFEDKLYVDSVKVNEKQDAIITIIDYDSENINIYEFQVTFNYPFSSPKLKINNKPYNEFLRINTAKFRYLLKKMKNFDCLCCNSYLCADRWTPAITLKKYLQEVREYRKCRRDIVNKYYADIIKDKYLIADIDLDSWLFTPLDI